MYRHFPLSPDPNSANQIISRAAEAAGEQGQFFEAMHLLYQRQDDLRTAAGDEQTLKDLLAEYAAELGLDVEQYEADLDSPEITDRVSAAFDQAVALGLQGTPSAFLNGIPFNPQAFGAPDDQWATFIADEKKLRDLPSYEAPPMTIDPEKIYLASVDTDKGTFVLELYPQSAPLTVNSFIFLANEGWFEGVTFHRVIDGFVAQTGDPTGTGRGGPGYTIPTEIDPNLKHDGAGWVAMANSGPDTNGSQWYITYAAQPDLDGNYTIFGKVIEGMEVVESLTRRDPQTDPDAPPGDKIISITIEEK